MNINEIKSKYYPGDEYYTEESILAIHNEFGLTFSPEDLHYIQSVSIKG